jgi:hypothetical protein
MSGERKYWQIVDIGEGGLAFRYVPDGGPLDDSGALVIATKDLLFYVEGIPFRIVSLSDIGESLPPTYWRREVLKRYGVEFGNLNVQQISQVEHFIQEYAVSEV